MLCTKCGKNEATVYFSKTINGKTEEYRLCPECAKKSGVMESFDRDFNVIQNNFFSGFPFGGSLLSHRPFGGFSLGNLMDSFFDRDLFTLGEAKDTCPYCGCNFEDYKKTGKFGCAMCYETFKDRMEPAGVTAGKTDSKAEQTKESVSEQISGLKAKLQEAIKTEHYEDAAKFRDEIKRLEGGTN